MKKITLKSDDGETFEVEEAVAINTLGKMIEYYKKHHEEAIDGNWDADFVKVDQSTLFDLILTGNYRNITSLLDLTCQTVADMIKGKTLEKIRETFNIKNDFMTEKEEEVHKENQWAFE
ncbi:hypothetical protein PRUPE_7G020800 [Prunus persica]|uniref:SKP1-like protein n=1 Tax=Prunus persica TaxID=3760 RepID=A0A251N590_PRUPE|nr:hypothetical protein PRUPE_7G020800 [Prunus persica]